MALTASCPSCGAPVAFKSNASVFAVCAYCQSTLVRHDQNLEDIGKMAPLVEDRSPLRLGAEGSYQGVHFALIGRIQIQYSQGIWNEWHLLFDDMRTGWLSEAGGEYVLTFMHQVDEPLPAFSGLRIGQRLQVASQVWTVSNLENAACVAGEGELPFKVGAGYPVAAADLRNERHFATLDYSETPPLLFVGEAVDFRSLRLSNLRDGQAARDVSVQVQVFRCPSCASPMQARAPDILAVACASCGTVVDAGDPAYPILSRLRGRRDEIRPLRLPLGSKGTLEGRPVEVIGHLVRRARIEGIAYLWSEYLLAAEHGTYRWLTEYNGHWNVVDVLSRPPTSKPVIETDSLRYDGALFKHFSTTPRAEVVQIDGEFTWRVRHGETCRVVDYVAPPRLLSKEVSDNDLTWSLGHYVTPEEIAEAFGLTGKLPATIGIHANQPNPWAATARRSWRLFARLALVALLVQAFFVMVSSERLLLRQDFSFEPGLASEVQSREFTLAAQQRKIAVRQATSLDNNWLGVDLLLVNKSTGQVWSAAREISYYWGYDDGRWTEGSRDDEVVFRNVPPGSYYLTLDPEMPPNAVVVHDRLEVVAPRAGWSNFVIVLIFLAAFPVFAALRTAAFETRRWAESDHAPEGGDDAGGDD